MSTTTLRTLGTPEEVENPTPAQFWDICARFDWYYAMSDDHRVWERGVVAEGKLKAHFKANPALKPMYDEWCTYYRDYSDPTRAKPTRPAE